MSECELLLSGFADEAANDKTIEQQFVAFSALGLRYLSLRFIDVGNGIKNVIDLDDAELDVVLKNLELYDLQVSSIGSPLGKTKLLDVDDGSSNTFFPFDEYLETTAKVCRIANRLGSKLIRGFSFYHPRNESPEDYVAEAASRLKSICELCDSHGLTFGLEVEANLIGQNAELLMALHEQVASEAMVLIFDGANLVTQGFSETEVIQQFETMSEALGWIHIKDHVPLSENRDQNYVDEEALCGFVAAGAGASGYLPILEKFKGSYAKTAERMKARGVPGIFADLEPHLKGGGQFGGFSGPDGFGIAARAFRNLCVQAGVGCPVRQKLG